MPTYQLQIQLDDDAVARINQANQQIVITKQVTGSGTPLVWLAFDAFPMNSVTWQDQYSVYASQVQLQSGATIAQIASRSAAPRAAYSFDNNVFSPDAPHSPLSTGTYEVINDSSRALTFGISQSATVNTQTLGASAIFAASLLPGQWLDMTPSETISIFLYNSTQSAMCLGTVMGPGLTVPFGGANTSQTISFDYNIGGFQFC
jgi:hypothetical protein